MSERVNLTPAVWGPKTWFFLESMAMGYPENPTDDEKLSVKNLILSLKDLLPCYGCRVNYRDHTEEYFKTIPLDEIVKKRSLVIAFIIDIHNKVREMNKAPIVSVEDTFKYYNNEYMSFNVKKIVPEKEEFTQNKFNLNNKIGADNLIKSLLYQFNPLMILIGIILGLIIYKFFQETLLLDQDS